MSFEINVDKYSFAAEPEKASQNYAAELAKKLVEEEKAERSAEDASLSALIKAEGELRKTKDNELVLEMTELNSKIVAESANRISQDQALSDSISTETVQRKKADSDLVFEMTEMASQLEERINNEVEERITQDSKLSQKIESEAAERATQIAELQAEDKKIWDEMNGIGNAVNGANEGINMLDQIKADKATTLAGYGITDAISINGEVYEDEIDSLFSYGGMRLYKVIGSTSGVAYENFTPYYLFEITESKVVYGGNTVWQYRVTNGIIKYRIGKHPSYLGFDSNEVSWGEWKEYITNERVEYIQEDISTLIQVKADKTIILTDTDTTEYVFDFSDMYNKEIRLHNASAISIKFVDNEYSLDYISGLSFNSGETPTSFDYADSGIINWVGTDCVKDGGLSIFEPSANTHYDIVFYFNGSQFIGLVNGFVPASGNEVEA